ncbi:MAG: signal peptidase I [Firmicutes bacterium]|nr:signal peptidase I [Bacillota bacterium]
MEQENHPGQKERETARSIHIHKEIEEWIVSILLAVVLAVFIRIFFFQVTIVEGTSMLPTLENYERLIINKAVYHLKKPQKGDIVVFNFSSNRDFIKRIVALEGDEVEIKEDQLYINGQICEEPYLEIEYMPDFGPAIVPQDHVFVLGDNRLDSMDSRDPTVGYVSIGRIRGKAALVFWPPINFRLL